MLILMARAILSKNIKNIYPLFFTNTYSQTSLRYSNNVGICKSVHVFKMKKQPNNLAPKDTHVCVNVYGAVLTP